MDKVGQVEKSQARLVDETTMYEVDFRELELRAAKAEAAADRVRSDAEKAKYDLLRAKLESPAVLNR